MRVLIATGLYPPDVGGPATYTEALVTGLRERGVVASVLPFSRVRHLPTLVRHVRYFFLALREGEDADIIYAQDPFSVGLPAFFAARMLGKKFLLKVVGDFAWEQATQRFDYEGTVEAFQKAEIELIPAIMRALERFVARRAARVVVPSRYLGRVVARWGVPKKNITVIYNGMERIVNPGNKQVLRGLLKFHGKLIVSAGRLVPWKGFPELIALVHRMKRDFPDLKLLIIGSGPDLSALEAQAKHAGIADDVIFTGALPREVLLRYVRAADVFVLNSRYEGFSHQLLEVMAVGVPIIATKIGGVPEAIEDGKNGFLVAPNDAARMEMHLRALFSSSALRARLLSNARRTVAVFSNERMITETVALMRKL